MNYDHPAVRKAYPDAVIVDDGNGVFKADGTKITIDQTLVDAARVELDKLKYRTDRTTNGSTTYAAIGDQLDLLWHAIDADTDLKSKFSAFYNSIKTVKDANPKP